MTARYKQDKEALKKAIERQPNIWWPEEVSEWDWPRRPTIEHLRKVLRGDYGYHPAELDRCEHVENIQGVASDSSAGALKATVGLVEHADEVTSKPRYSDERTELASPSATSDMEMDPDLTVETSPEIQSSLMEEGLVIPPNSDNEEVCPEPNENELMSLVQAYIQADTHRSAEFAKFVSKKGRDIPAPELDEYNALGLRIFEDIKWKTDWPGHSKKIPATILYRIFDRTPSWFSAARKRALMKKKGKEE
ncbi:hypothetical protein L208DRAFT_1462388 [Tricholoma matsutake]|nr:hypothetical protein L208DRAFT_1462388 [Tricholoma matsutake 945]